MPALPRLRVGLPDRRAQRQPGAADAALCGRCLRAVRALQGDLSGESDHADALSAAGDLVSEIDAAQAPIIAVALSRDGRLIAAAGMRGSVAIIDRLGRKMARTLVGPGLPVWSVAFFPDGRTLLTGGSDRMIRRSDAMTSEPIGNVVMGAPAGPLAD